MQDMTLLIGHSSPETAYVIADYPYSFTLRCKMRVWIEYKQNKGFRLVRQTSNPKRSHTWNAEKYSTYSRFGMAMYLDGEQHVQSTGLHEYTAHEQVQSWVEKFRDGVPAEGVCMTDKWLKAVNAHAQFKIDNLAKAVV